MNWTALLFISVLSLQALGKQENSRRHNLPQKTVRLDPLLRRALLRALSELEKEAQEKIKREEIEKFKSTVRIVGKRGNVQNPERGISEDEIQKTADSSYPTPNPVANGPQETEYPQETTTANGKDKTEPPFSVTVKDTFFFHTPSPIEQDVTSATQQETTRPDSTLLPPEFENNLISQANVAERRPSQTTDKSEVATTTAFDSERITPKVTKKPAKNENEVELFKAPLVAAFTLHQDSKGVPKSVVPLLRHPQDLNKHKLLLQQHQLAQLKQQQQQLILQHQHQILQQRQNLASQQQHQQQFFPRVTITPLSQPNNFNQQQNFFGSASHSTSFPSSTAFPPLASNSISPQNFHTSVIPAQGFHVSSTVTETRNSNQEFASTPSPIVPAQGFHVSSTVTESRNNNEGFAPTPAPLRNFPSQSISPTPQPQSDFNKAISVIPSHNFNFASTLQPNLPSPTPSPQTFQAINIPQVTLPLQNEQTRFQSQLPEANQNQQFLDEQNRQRQIEELNRLRFAEEQKRQRQIIEQSRLKQLEERRKKVSEAQAQQDGLNQFRQQREELGIDFLRSVGFTFDNAKPEFAKQFQIQQPQVAAQHKSPFNFNFQSSQTFGNTAFQDVESRNRVNRQEGFGSTGNFGFNRPANQLHQFQKDANQRNVQHGQVHFRQSIQHFPNFQQQQQHQQQQQQQYRTIPEEHYRNFQGNRFQQNNFQQRNNFQFANHQSQFQQPTTESVNKQLEHLLLQSGLAAGHVGREEDLNIVSKVLALNHERADRNVQERSDKIVPETQSIRRSERRARENSRKGLRVGEISEPSTGAKYSGPQ